jgi:phage terminase large subunit-like protein
MNAASGLAVRDVDPEGRPTLGWQVIQWIETYLPHGPGDVQGDPIRLDDELAAFILRCYALNPETGRRLYDEALLSRPKGRAKSELAGMLVCAEALGPVRFARWEGGEPVGRPIKYPFIRCLSTEEGQSGHTYLNTAYMLSEARERHPDTFAGVDIGRDWQSSTRTFLPGGGEIRPSTASSAAKDGGKETLAVFDEPHLYVLAENRAMYRTVKRNLAKRRSAEPWGLLTSTMYAPGEESTCEAIHEAHHKGQRPRTLFDHKGVDYPLDLADDLALEKALRYVYGPFIEAMDLDRLKAEVRDPTADENEQRRYFLNERRAGSARWMDPRVWAARADPAVVVADGEPIALGFDGSISRDASALVGCTRGGHLFVVEVWERPQGPAGEGWVVPTTEVDQAVRTAFARWPVARMYADPAWWRGWISSWAEEFGKDIVAEFPTNSAARMAPAVEALDTAVKQGELSHDGDSRLARHVGNAHRLYVRLRTDDGERRPFVLQKERPHSPRKIDGAVAGVLALAARNDAIAAGVFPEADYNLLGSIY